jgi:hypothetical protein
MLHSTTESIRCDCGDPELFKLPIHCSLHRYSSFVEHPKSRDISELLPIIFRENLEAIISVSLNFITRIFDALPVDHMILTSDSQAILSRYKVNFPVSETEQSFMNHHYGGKRLYCLSLSRTGCGPDLAAQLMRLTALGITESSQASIIQQVMESSDVCYLTDSCRDGSSLKLQQISICYYFLGEFSVTLDSSPRSLLLV